MEDKLTHYLKEYSEVTQTVHFLYELRFKVATVYVVGMLGSVALSLAYNTLFGLLLGIGSTGVMGILDSILHRREELYSFKAAKLEKKIYRIRGDDVTEILDGMYNLYFKTFWKFEKEFEHVTVDDLRLKWVAYYMKSRGWLYLTIMILVSAYSISYAFTLFGISVKFSSAILILIGGILVLGGFLALIIWHSSYRRT